PEFTEDKWVSAAEVVPGNRAVVHHVLVFAREKDSRDGPGEAGGGFLAAYVPGLKPAVYPKGMAKLVPAGSELIFQVHYTPIGSAQTDVTKIGLVFADPAKIEHLVETRNAVQPRLDIQPQKANQKYEAKDSIAYDDAILLACMPHMHLRGQAFRYSLERDGESKTLLDVPRYDFNWQTGYAFAEPLPLEKGDRILCEAWFDNSSDNLANPDPAAKVRWGDQTWNEMMIGYYDVAVPLDEQAKMDVRSGRLGTALRDRLADRIGAKVRDIFHRYDADDDEGLTPEEVPDRLRPLHSQLDKDGDGRVTAEELRPVFERQE
ncbi:MAG: alkyl hydroperoxide reductase, partial [Planctomycetota bacterium]|nr:alkyl hydroperoxide reductase [Planctomycetota bacterium]